MKTTQRTMAWLITKYFLLALISFSYYSCSDDDFEPEPEEIIQEDPEEESPDPVTYTVSELVTGASITGANGMNFSPSGNLFVGSFLGLEILELNTENGEVVSRLGQDMGVRSPDDLVFGPDGSLYWTDIIIGEVGRMAPDGTVTKQFVAPGVNPITFSEDGRLFVGLCFIGDGLYELDPNLLEPPRPIVVATPENPFPLGFFNAFDFGADGRLYGPLFVPGFVMSIDVDREGDPTSDPFADGSAQILAGGFVDPVAAKFDPSGLLTVLDQTGEVFKIDPMSGATTPFANLQPGLDNLAFDAEGNLYISSADEGWVIELLPDGQERTISSGGIIAPQGIQVMSGTNNEDILFVADQFRLREIDGNNGELLVNHKGFLVPGEGTLTLPQNLSADGENLIVTSGFAAMVQVWHPENGVLESYPMGTPELPGLPVDAIRFKEDIVVNDLVQGGLLWASDNSIIAPIDGSTLILPTGLATDGESIWVTDWAAGDVLRIDFDGQTPLTPVVVASNLTTPEGLAIDADGNLLVVEWALSQLTRIDVSTGESTMIANGLELHGPGLEGFPPNWLFDGVTIGQSGAIYVSGGGKNVVYKITKD